VTVPTGATTGNVVVTVGGQASNGVPFSVIPPPSIFGSEYRHANPFLSDEAQPGRCDPGRKNFSV
jgi:hypothetical protein